MSPASRRIRCRPDHERRAGGGGGGGLPGAVASAGHRSRQRPISWPARDGATRRRLSVPRGGPRRPPLPARCPRGKPTTAPPAQAAPPPPPRAPPHHRAQVFTLQLKLRDPQEPLGAHTDHAVPAQPVDLLDRLLVDGQRALQRSELVLVGHGLSFRAARAMAAILSAKFTWLSSCGS